MEKTGFAYYPGSVPRGGTLPQLALLRKQETRENVGPRHRRSGVKREICRIVPVTVAADDVGCRVFGRDPQTSLGSRADRLEAVTAASLCPPRGNVCCHRYRSIGALQFVQGVESRRLSASSMNSFHSWTSS